MTAVLICVQNELVCVCLRRCCCWQSAVTVVKCSWKKKKGGWGLDVDTLGSQTKRFAGCCDVCVSNDLSRWARAGPSKSRTSKKGGAGGEKRNGSCLQKRQTLTFLFSTSVTVATSEMSEMSFALKKKLRQTFKGTLDDCLNFMGFFFFRGGGVGVGAALLMIPSQLFVFLPSSLKTQVADKDCLDVHFFFFQK